MCENYLQSLETALVRFGTFDLSLVLLFDTLF